MHGTEPSNGPRHVTLVLAAVAAVIAVVCVVLTHRWAYPCVHNGTDHRTGLRVLILIFGVTASGATLLLPRPRLVFRIPIAVVVGLAAALGLAIYGVGVWLGHCD
jgi:hypothetical protein